MSSRAAYKGSRRQLVIAVDVGTTYSGISYSILDPGQCPTIYEVTRFPAQEIMAGASKIPSIIYYDDDGTVGAIGAEAIKDGIREAAIEGNWHKAEWFKLHLRSKYNDGYLGHNVPPLPPNKTVVDVFADYLRYLLQCAASYIKESHVNGQDLWNTAKDDIKFVISHPNGWEGKEQSQMRKAAVKAGFIPDDHSGHSRLTFVTEGEASLHFAIENGILSQIVKGQGILIVDAGGGTIDVSTYKRTGTDSKATKTLFEEIAVPKCYFQGSIFVTLRAMDFIRDLLVDSPFTDDLDEICDYFDKTTKTRFRDSSEPQYIRFGSTRDNDPSCGIRFGQLKLAGGKVAQFFQPSIDCIVQAAMEQKRTSQNGISHVILVGGFAGSDYISKQIEAQLRTGGLTLVRPNNRANKTVSDGAISFFLDHYVRTRVARVSYGLENRFHYNERDPEHIKRAAFRYTAVDGLPCLRGGFSVVLPKNTQVSETKEFVQTFTRVLSKGVKPQILMCYRGSDSNPRWIDTEPENFTPLCGVHFDWSQIPQTAKRNTAGKVYFEATYDIVLIFGLTELQAQVRWFEDGVERRTPAQTIYDDV